MLQVDPADKIMGMSGVVNVSYFRFSFVSKDIFWSILIILCVGKRGGEQSHIKAMCSKCFHLYFARPWHV